MSCNDTTVLFQRGNDDSNGVFDDTELIDAWNRQLQKMKSDKIGDDERSGPIQLNTSKRKKSPLGSDEDYNGYERESDGFLAVEFKSRAQEDDEESEEGDDDEVPKQSRNNSTLIPPTPQGISQEVADLLRSWYDAGYRTGHYVASNKFKTKEKGCKRSR
eukprot:Tbor_TRINITY_DN5465_c5_g2::TRINITY_DN5465_c5_g2_i1::g.24547::m.24547